MNRPPIQQCRRCGAPLSERSSFCPECGALQRAAPIERVRAPRRPWWVPAGLAAGGLAAVLGGALVGVLVLGTPDPGRAGASPTLDASATANASAPSDASVPPATPVATPTSATVAAPIIPNRAIAEVTTGGDLNLRAASNQGAEVLGVLKQGQRLFVIGEPVERDGLRWYRVATVNDPTQCAETCGLIGFAATPPTDEDRWIAEVELSCPSSPMTADAIGGLQPLEALSCYGRSDIVVTGTMDMPFHGPITPYRYDPQWLRTGYSAYMYEAPWIWFVTPPDSGLDPVQAGQIVRVTGHLEDPAAPDCRATVNADFFGGEVPESFVPIDRARVVLDCRATFIWTDYEIIGFDGLQAPDLPVLANDAPSLAHQIAPGDTFETDTVGAASEPEHACIDPERGPTYLGKTAWWSFAGTGEPVTIDTAGSSFDTVIGVYREVDHLEPIGCVDDVLDSLQARISVETEAGRRYVVQVGGYAGDSGLIVISLD